MKRFISFLLLFLTASFFTFSDSIINDIDIFSKLFPRTEGSENEKAVFRYISARLSELDVAYMESGFSETEGYHSYSSYIEADFPGKSPETLITVVPVEGNYNTAAALALTEYFSINQPELTMKFIFLGAEQSGGINPGTRNFLEHFYPETETAFIYLNFSGFPESFKIVSGADGYSSPYFLFKAVTSALDKTDIPWFHSTTESILFRLSAAGTESRIKQYLAEGYPAIEMGSYRTVMEAGDIPADSASLVNFYNGLLAEFSNGLPSEWDSHYVFFLNEQMNILIYMVVLSLLMIYPIFRRRHFGWYMQTLLRNLWSPPVLFLSVFILLSLSSFILSLLLEYTGFPEMWKYTPVRVFLFKISTTLLFYTLTFRFIKKLPFSKRGSFYSISAILFLVIALFILSWINLSLSIFALWPLCFIFLFTIFRKPFIKLLMLIISPLWVVFILYEIFTLPSVRVIEILTVSPVTGNLLITLMILPYILAAIRLDLMSPPSKKLTRFFAPVLTVSSIVFLVLILFNSPFNSINPQPVTISETVSSNEGESSFSVSSPKRLSPSIKEQLISQSGSGGYGEDSVSIELESKPFLNRKIIDARLSFSFPPEKVRFRLTSDEPLVLYESSYPAEWFPSKKTLEVYIGKNPPVPLDISLTLNRNAATEYTAEADFPVVISRQRVEDDIYLVRRQITAEKTVTSDEE